jgi:molybdopterin-guanine dinucleotide biosynthesis protein A
MMRFSAALLAGGRSRRMGRDKAFIEIGGVPLWQRQLQILQKLAPAEIFISGPARPEWISSGATIVSDSTDDVGPIGGLIAVLQCCRTSHVVVLAVDLPQMTSDYLRDLLAVCSETAGVIPTRANQFEPLIAVYPVAAIDVANECIHQGDYSLQKVAARCASQGLLKAKPITPSEESLFLNMNTLGDLSVVSAHSSQENKKQLSLNAHPL